MLELACHHICINLGARTRLSPHYILTLALGKVSCIVRTKSLIIVFASRPDPLNCFRQATYGQTGADRSLHVQPMNSGHCICQPLTVPESASLKPYYRKPCTSAMQPPVCSTARSGGHTGEWIRQVSQHIMHALISLHVGSYLRMCTGTNKPIVH